MLLTTEGNKLFIAQICLQLLIALFLLFVCLSVRLVLACQVYSDVRLACASQYRIYLLTYLFAYLLT